jgi:uncharacterized protein
VGIKVENDFVIPAPIENAWKVLIDIPRVVPCMPGSAVTEEIDAQHFRATARIKVGPVELQFRGDGEFFDVDPSAYSAKLRAKGSDAKGRGSFQAAMAFVLTAQGNETRAVVNTDITLSGSVAQYGRGSGLIKEITNQLTTQFAANLSALIAAERVMQQAAKPGNGGAMQSVSPAVEALTSAPPSLMEPTVVNPPASVRAEGSTSRAPSTPSASQAAPVVAAPISGLSLLFGALKAIVRRWFGLKT